MKPTIEKLQLITPQYDGEEFYNQLNFLLQQGIRWVQLRLKKCNDDDFLTIAKQVKNICEQYSAVLLINDRVDIAIKIHAHGVHLGKNDMPAHSARKLLGEHAIIGGTANTIEDIKNLYNHVDYIGLGPFRFTQTKENLSPILGINGYQTIINQCNEAKIITPIIAVGGITKDDITPIIKTGLYGVAISSFLWGNNNVKELLTIIN
ncbi:MAG: thiamine phosphate synthase [Bacteroidales bacterium]